MKKTIPNLLIPVNLLKSYIIYLKFMYLALARKVLELFNCYHYGDNYFFEAEPNRYCYESWWYAMLGPDLFGLAVYVVGIPAVMIFLHFRSRYLIRNVSYNARTTLDKVTLILTFKKGCEFRKGFEFWDTMVAVRKLIILLAQLFFSRYPTFQAIMMIISLNTAVFIQIYLNPYSSKSLNNLEAFTIMATILILLAGIMFKMQEFEQERERIALAYFVIGIIVTSISSVILVTVVHLRDLIKIYRDRKKANNSLRKGL